MSSRRRGGDPDPLRADLRWNLLFVPWAVSAPALGSTRPLAGRTGVEIWEVVQGLVPILFLRACGLMFVGVGVLALSDWALSGDSREFGYSTARGVMMWTAVQLGWLGMVAGVLKRSKWRDQPLPADAALYRAIQAAPLVGVVGATAVALAFH